MGAFPDGYVKKIQFKFKKYDKGRTNGNWAANTFFPPSFKVKCTSSLIRMYLNDPLSRWFCESFPLCCPDACWRCVITHYTLWWDLCRACDYVTASWEQNCDSIPDASKKHSSNAWSELRLMTQVVFARLVLSCSQRLKNSIVLETVTYFSAFSYFFMFVCVL